MSSTDPEFWARLNAHSDFAEQVKEAWRALATVIDSPLLGDYQPQRDGLAASLRWLEMEAACGDCVEGRCHFGGDGAEPGDECGCERHEFSVEVRARNDR